MKIENKSIDPAESREIAQTFLQLERLTFSGEVLSISEYNHIFRRVENLIKRHQAAGPAA